MNLLCNDLPERNMTDKELLGAAARAAGKSVKWDSVEACFYRETKGTYGNPEWDPLTRDADALQLAVKLGMSIASGTYKVVCEYVPQEDGPNVCVSEQYGKDEYAATRRAIVRAAAEIGSLHNAEVNRNER